MSQPTYSYTGFCPATQRLLQLPRTFEVEAIARDLMSELDRDDKFAVEGKMYGVLLVETKLGTREVLKAFSGLLNGAAIVTGWVPPLPGRDRVAAAEAETLADLAAMKQELIELDQSPVRAEYQRLAATFSDRLELLSIEHRQRKELRQRERERLAATLSAADLAIALEQLEQESRQDSRERRHFKQDRDAVLQPLQAILAQTEARIRELRQQRKMRSRQLQTQMHEAYRLMNFLGTSSSLRDLMPAGMPTGTGDCCAPKLLHYAASHQLKPIAMAEFWWGESSGDKRQGEFYGACLERCQPLMGFMLAGLTAQPSNLENFSIPIVYEDEYLIAVDKPSGLLSVPGRSLDTQDSVLTRLQQLFIDEEFYPVHRLDRDTSGILLVARDRQTYRHLSQQFRTRQVFKVYEALLAGEIAQMQGSINLPLAADLTDRPRQIVDLHHGKPSITKFQVLAKIGGYTRIEFIPITGRTHQLRVHAAAPQGLGVPILGDRLYGCQTGTTRLHLHARELSFVNLARSTGHTISNKYQQLPQRIHLCVKSPF
jgi:tRNA pseudouridine32 synthase / 23S rRNA pseudouridine746 synthase